MAPNYYGTVSNGFISFPTPMTGDFSIAAQVTITTQNKANNACGIGVGLTTGFAGTDAYAYTLMRNSNNSTNGYSVSAAGAISAGAPTVAFTNGTPLQLTFSSHRQQRDLRRRSGRRHADHEHRRREPPHKRDERSTAPARSTPRSPSTTWRPPSPNLVIKDATGATVYDSATGTLVNYVPASLTLSASHGEPEQGRLDVRDRHRQRARRSGLGRDGGIRRIRPSPRRPSPTARPTRPSRSAASRAASTTVTVTNTGDTNSATNTKTILVSVAEYAATDPYGSLALLAYPAPGATNAYTDGELALTFDAPPTLNTGGMIKIFALADGSEVDSIAFADETQTFGTTAINVGSQLVRVSGNTVFFTPHLGKLAYGTAYYVAIPTTSITGTLTGVAFNGLSNLSTVATWKFTTRAAPTLSAASVTVDGAQTSTANFRTLQGALGGLAAGLPTATTITINVAAGTYNELVHYTGPGATQTINIVGPAGNTRGDNCIVQYANGNMVNGSTSTRAAVYLTGTNVVLQNITLKNTGVRSVVSQAEALYFAGGSAFTLAAFNSSFSSNQDTIQTSGRNWFYNCYIEGNVDFIWGTADAALFESCSLRFINDVGGGAASYGLFVARTGATIAAGANGTVPKGYVLLNSTVSVDANVTAYFGRDAGTGAFYDQAALINVVFSGAGMLGAGIWNVTTAPLSLGDSSYVGWKSAGCSGLNLASLTTDPKTSATIASQATEYDTRDHILNRVVTVTAGVPSGYQAAATSWDVSALATAWGAP